METRCSRDAPAARMWHKFGHECGTSRGTSLGTIAARAGQNCNSAAILCTILPPAPYSCNCAGFFPSFPTLEAATGNFLHNRRFLSSLGQIRTNFLHIRRFLIHQRKITFPACPSNLAQSNPKAGGYPTFPLPAAKRLEFRQHQPVALLSQPILLTGFAGLFAQARSRLSQTEMGSAFFRFAA